MSWNIQLDNNWEREGFVPASIATDSIKVGGSERFTAETVLIAVLTYVGGKLIDKLTDRALSKGIDAAIDKLAAFAQSKEKKLRIELEDRDFDPRVRLVAAKIESMDRAQFEDALSSIPTMRTHAAELLETTGEDLTDVWYVWDGEKKEWTFSYYTTTDNDVVDEDPCATNSARAEG